MAIIEVTKIMQHIGRQSNPYGTACRARNVDCDSGSGRRRNWCRSNLDSRQILVQKLTRDAVVPCIRVKD